MENKIKEQGRRNKFYPDSLKIKICKEYIEESVSISYLRRKYDLRSNSSIHYWLRKFGFNDSGHTRSIETKCFMDTIDQATESELKARIKKLERELEDSEIKSEMYSMMIDIAEKQFNINIRKKSDTK